MKGGTPKKLERNDIRYYYDNMERYVERVLRITEPYQRFMKQLSEEVKKLGAEKHAIEKAKGMKPQPIKAMIIGVPNVGKSSLINRIAKRNAAGVQNKPGFTRGEQYIKVNNDHKKNKKKESESNKPDSDYVMILYFIDETEIKALKQKVEDQDLSMGIIMIDNYEEISQRMTSEVRPVFIAQVEKKIYDYTAKYDVIMVKTEKDTFYCVANHASIEKMTDDKFSILNEVKTVEFPDSVPATLSIAFSDDGDTGIKKTESARAAIDIALGRGGDQAIIKENANYKFFGGRTTEVEKRTKVKARMVSHGLQKLIEESDMEKSVC